MTEKKLYIGAMRGRDKDNPSIRVHTENYEQRFEINKDGICNCLTTVQKDNLVLEVIKDE